MRIATLSIAACFAFAIGCQHEAAEEPVSLSSGLAAQPVPELNVSINGKPANHHVQYIGGEGGEARYLLDIGLMHLMLGPERELHFTWRGDGNSHVFLTSPGQAPRVVGVRVRTLERDGNHVLVNPLEFLSESDMCRLWGLEINHWSPEIVEKLNQIDFARTCVTIRGFVATKPQCALPPLPPELTTLRIETQMRDGLMKNFSELRNLKNLKSLTLERALPEPFDCSLLKQMTQLESLDVSQFSLKNSAALASLKNLRVLDMQGCKNLTDLAFVRSMKKLETLDVSSTGVSDLTPLNGLINLRKFKANATTVSKLPDSVPNLRHLHGFWTRLTDADVRAFQQANPECTVRYRWVESLHAALQPATRLRIRSGGLCDRNESRERTLFETSSAQEVKQLLAGLQIVDLQANCCDPSCGNPSLELYDGDQLVASLGIPPGPGLLWDPAWPEDAGRPESAGWPVEFSLTKHSSSFLSEWLASRGVTSPLKARQGEIR